MNKLGYTIACALLLLGEHQVVSFRVSAVGYGTGKSVLAVATDRGAQPHHSLQLDLNRFMALDEKEVKLTHNGSLSLGEGGSLKQAVVLDYVGRRAPDLVVDQQILLGTFPTDELVTWSNAEPLFENLIRYVLLRDELREAHRTPASS